MPDKRPEEDAAAEMPSGPAPILTSATSRTYGGVRVPARLLVHAMTGFDGNPAQASTLLFVPDGAPPAGGWPLVAWAHGTTTPGHRECGPSLWPNLDAGLTEKGFALDYAALIDALVAHGFAVVAPDLEGLGAAASGPYPYYSGASIARSLLWGMRAAREAEPTLSTRYVAFGHSEGGRGVLYVERYADETPELRQRGTIASAPFASVTGIVAEKEAIAASSEGQAAADARTQQEFNVALLTVGLLVQDPTFETSAVMGTDLAALLPAFRERCSVDAVGVIGDALAAKGSAFEGHRPDWAAVPAMAAFLRANDPAAAEGPVPRLPTLIVQGERDESVSASRNRALADRWRAAGAPVRYLGFPEADHFTITGQSRADVISFLETLFREPTAGEGPAAKQ